MATLQRILRKPDGSTLTLDDLEALAADRLAFEGIVAENLSYFSGNPNAGNQRSNHFSNSTTHHMEPSIFGLGNDLLTFLGDANEATVIGLENAQEKQFTITLANTSGAQRSVRLFSGFRKGNLTLAPGQLTDAAFLDMGGVAGLTGSSSSTKTIEELQLYVNKNPTIIKGLRVEATTSEQISKVVEVKEINPLKPSPRVVRFYPNDEKRSTDQNDKLVILAPQVPILVGPDTEVIYAVAATTTVTITLYFGHSLSTQLYLERQAINARKAANFVGGPQALQYARNQAEGQMLRLG